MPIRHRFTSPVVDDNDPDDVGPNEWNDTHEFTWRVVTAAETLASGDPLVADLAANATFPLPGTIFAGQTFALRNSPSSAAGVVVSLNPGASRSVIYGDGQSTPVGDTITLARGETISLVALSNTELELVTPGAVGPAGPAGAGAAVTSTVTPTALAASAAIGTSAEAARADHAHARPTPAEIGAEAAGAVAAHVAAGDPHPQYLTPAEGNAAYAALSHTHPASQISDSTTAGRALLTAADAAAQRALLNVANGATANATDVQLRDRATHTGTQAASTISDFAATVRAQVEAALLAGANITITPAGSGATRTLSLAAPGGGGGGSPGGSNRQIQFNNSGALGGSPNVRLATANDNLELGNFFDQAAGSIPAAPAAGFGRYFSHSRAGRILPHYMGPAGVDVALQPSLFGNSVIMWLPSTGTTVAINFGEAWTARNAGTGAAQAHPTRASTNALTSMKRATFSTGTTATGSSGIQSTNTVAWRGNAANLGGFFYFSRFGVETYRSDIQLLVGLSALNAALAGEPSAQANTIGIGKDSTDTNWFLIARNGSTVTKTDTGIAVTAGVILDFMMFAAPNGSSVTCRLVNAVDGTVYVDNVVLTTNLPVATTFLNAHAQIRSTTGTTAALLALNRIYVETDL